MNLYISQKTVILIITEPFISSINKVKEIAFENYKNNLKHLNIKSISHFELFFLKYCFLKLTEKSHRHSFRQYSGFKYMYFL